MRQIALNQSEKDGLWKGYFHGLTIIEDSAETMNSTFDSVEEMLKTASIRMLLNKIKQTLYLKQKVAFTS